jgi:hypothetical protein
MTTNDKDTFFSRAQADADLGAQGRFKKETMTKVTGVPRYPQQPTNSPWHDNPVPYDAVTDQLGFAVNAIEPVGTEKEIQSSLGGSSSSLAVSPSVANDQQVPPPNLDPASAGDGPFSSTTELQVGSNLSSKRRQY